MTAVNARSSNAVRNNANGVLVTGHWLEASLTQILLRQPSFPLNGHESLIATGPYLGLLKVSVEANCAEPTVDVHRKILGLEGSQASHIDTMSPFDRQTPQPATYVVHLDC
jgi:hypothetical protein